MLVLDLEVNNPQMVLRVLFRYLIEGMAVMFVAHRLLKGQSFENFGDLIILGVTAATVLSLIDTFAPPNVIKGIRQGAGMAIGYNMVKA